VWYSFVVEGVAKPPERSGGFALLGLQLEHGVLAKEVQFLEFYFEILDGSGRDAYVVRVAMVVVGDDCGCRFVGLVCGFVFSVADC